MILKELFDRVTFDQLLPYLLPRIEGHEDNIHHFREAYDLISLYRPIQGFATTVWITDDGEVDNAFHIGVRFLDGDTWPHSLAKEVIFEEGVSFNEAEVLAACLWEMTFFGYSEEEITGEGDEIGFSYAPKWRLNAQYESLSKRMDKHGYRWKQKMNRSKRKRNFRQSERLDLLECLAKRETLILRMKEAFPDERLGFLLSIDRGMEYHYRSTLADGNERLPYILKSMTVYQQMDKSPYEEAYVWAYVPSNFPWPESDWLHFQEEIRQWLGMPVHFGIVFKEMSCDEIGVCLLMFKR